MFSQIDMTCAICAMDKSAVCASKGDKPLWYKLRANSLVTLLSTLSVQGVFR